jgi:hypothetical protein
VPKDENSPFQKNTCVLECPNDKPFKDIDNYCKEECEYEGYKYYNPSENICKDKCPDNSKKMNINVFQLVQVKVKYLQMKQIHVKNHVQPQVRVMFIMIQKKIA